MHNQLDRQVGGASKCEPWDRVEADAGPCDQVVRLGQTTIFAALCRFVGVARGRRGLRSGTNVHPLEHSYPTHALFGIALQRTSVRWRSRPSRGLHANRALRPAQLGVGTDPPSRVARYPLEEKP